METANTVAVQHQSFEAPALASLEVLGIEALALLVVSTVALLEIRQRKRAKPRRPLMIYSRWRGLPEK
ncbi:hypothetical protein [Chitinolyticbacter meiyuanensis]|uniref:hypothetical protein n=1 Tax=Chitinolyticbacter meiyuanensis TaxID=682798 RepID=UPI0011E58C08|nr:hypothetical protein [Chitinolyticbacter meiyuanensis]